jgi:hypothetical protein
MENSSLSIGVDSQVQKYHIVKIILSTEIPSSKDYQSK